MRPLQHLDTSSAEAREAELQHWLRIDADRTDRVLRWLTEPIWDYAFRLRTYGVEHIPRSGGFLMCPNHSSYLDPFLQVRGQPRLVRFMGKAEIFAWPIVGAIVRSGGGFPVQRGQGDAFAMELARAMLADGQAVVMYPEGTRYRRDERLGEPHRGAARLALECGVPVVPVATWGTKPRRARGERWFPPRLPRVTTVYGPALTFDRIEPNGDNVARARDEIWRHVRHLYSTARDLDRLRQRPSVAAITGPDGGNAARCP